MSLNFQTADILKSAYLAVIRNEVSSVRNTVSSASYETFRANRDKLKTLNRFAF